MFDSISWQDYFTTIAVAVAIYYAITGLLLFHKEISNIFKQKSSNETSYSRKSDQNDSNESNDLLGKVRYASRHEENVPREESANAEDLSIAQMSEEEDAITPARDPEEEAIINSVSDLHQEVKSLADILSDGSKEDAAPLFQALLSNYVHLAGTVYQDSINQFILNTCTEKCQFDLTSEEIRSWWTDNQNNNH